MAPRRRRDGRARVAEPTGRVPRARASRLPRGAPARAHLASPGARGHSICRDVRTMVINPWLIGFSVSLSLFPARTAAGVEA